MLVIENDPSDDIRRLGGWLHDAGLSLETNRPYAGDQVPEALDGYAALVVLGGPQRAYPDPDGAYDSAWFPALEGLLRRATRQRVPALGICLGGQLLATAHAGTVQRSPAGPELGPTLVGRRDVAARDPLFGPLPMAPDVLQWHFDEITELPAGAVLLAASPRYAYQAFRVGPCAWGIQFHIECDTAMIAAWAAADAAALDELGYDADQLVAAADAVMGDLAEVWQPFAERFARVVRGELAAPDAPARPLPLLGGPAGPGHVER